MGPSMESAEGSPFLALPWLLWRQPPPHSYPGGHLEPLRPGRRASQSRVLLAMGAGGDTRATQKEEDQRT